MNASLFPPAVAQPRPLRSYQARAIEMVRAALMAGKRRPLLQLPTGAGKTRVASEIIRGARAKDKTAVFVVPRLSLIEQTIRAFERDGITDVGVIQGQHYRTDRMAPVQIASAQTLARREMPDGALVLVDECHLRHKAVTSWMADPEWASVPFIGLSATPWSRGLGAQFDALLQPVTIQELIDGDFLTPALVFAPPPPDLGGVRTNAGEFNECDLSDACNKKELIADIVETWIGKGENRPTLCYAVDRKHAQHLQERFIEAGVATAYVDCDTPMFEREEIFERFAASETKLICNVATLDTGLDLDVRCIIDARPTKSRIRFVQTIGRGLRPAEGKDHLIVLDHAGNHQRLGRVTDISFDHLDDGESNRNLDRGVAEREPIIRFCPACRCVLPPAARICPACGEQIFATTPVIEKAGELIELGSARRGSSAKEDVALWHTALARIAREKGYKSGWVRHQYLKKFGHWPPMFPPPEREPTVEIRNWVRSRQIAYAKAGSAHG